ncbi:MAG TPA: GNAT family N-acetyltransferase [Micromonosporaceae bacterium]|nr:GNAT family N-acetyltransferase [Micromonosporaceae bacterium]
MSSEIISYSAAHRAAVTALAEQTLDLPEDAGEAASVIDRLLDPPAGRHTVRLVALDPAGALTGVLFASVREGDPSVGHLDLVAVAAPVRRRGIARALITTAEETLHGYGVSRLRIAGNDPCYGWPGIDVRYTPAVCTALALGFEQTRTAWNMTVDLAGAVAPADAEAGLAAAGVTVRGAEPSDVPALEAFAASHFGGGWGWEAGQAIARHAAGAVAGCHLALRGAELLGFAAFGALRPSLFGPMATAPDAQGLGIGGVLLRRCLYDMRAAGLATAQIGWAGPVAFYAGAVAARIERVFVLYAKPL